MEEVEQERRFSVHAFRGAIAYGVTEGKCFFLSAFPLAGALPRRQSMLGQAQLSPGIFPKWEQ